MAAVANALPATTISGSVLTTAETTPALQNVIASNKPTWGTLTAGGQQNTGGGPLYTQGGWINTGGAPLYSGSLNTGSISSGSINTNGQPITAGALQLSQDRYIASYPQSAPVASFSIFNGCTGYSFSTLPGTLMIWAQPVIYSQYCGPLWTGPWGWYPSGSNINGGAASTMIWNTNFGTLVRLYHGLALTF